MTTVSVSLKQQLDYRFEIDFGNDVAPLVADEPPPLGKGEGPSPTQLICAAVGNCLSDSLLFALRKFKQVPEPLKCDVQAEVGRNLEGRLRIQGIHATHRAFVTRRPQATCTSMRRACACSALGMRSFSTPCASSAVTFSVSSSLLSVKTRLNLARPTSV
jgi:uncharacterized OsmC-like protein